MLTKLTSTLTKSTHLFRRAISSKALEIQVADKASLKPKLPKEDLIFGKTFTDHILEIDWDSTNGWSAPQIIPFDDLEIHPAASSLHYGLQCFEGMKAYVDDNSDDDFNEQVDQPHIQIKSDQSEDDQGGDTRNGSPESLKGSLHQQHGDGDGDGDDNWGGGARASLNTHLFK